MAMTKFNNWKKLNEGMEGPGAAPQAPEANVGLDPRGRCRSKHGGADQSCHEYFR
jgi:hypothetical protein